MENLFFDTFDGNKIFYRVWNFEKNKKTLIIIHRGHEHSERLNELAQDEKFLKYNNRLNKKWKICNNVSTFKISYLINL